MLVHRKERRGPVIAIDDSWPRGVPLALEPVLVAALRSWLWSKQIRYAGLRRSISAAMNATGGSRNKPNGFTSTWLELRSGWANKRAIAAKRSAKKRFTTSKESPRYFPFVAP
jgi:hypothetical protein